MLPKVSSAVTVKVVAAPAVTVGETPDKIYFVATPATTEIGLLAVRPVFTESVAVSVCARPWSVSR